MLIYKQNTLDNLESNKLGFGFGVTSLGRFLNLDKTESNEAFDVNFWHRQEYFFPNQFTFL